MDNSIILLIEEAIKNKNDEQIILNISSKIGMDVQQTKLFIKYYQKFIILSSILDSEYLNYFNKINLIDLKEEDELTNENFAKAVIMFIKNKRPDKKLYSISLKKENDAYLNILILSQLDYKSLIYDINYISKENINHLNLNKLLNLLKYIYNLNYDYHLDSLSRKLVVQQIDSPFINTINLDDLSYDTIFNYSQKYPNRIKNICYYFFSDFEKMKKLLDLNSESLISYPHGNIEYLIPLPNAYIFNLNEYKGNIDNTMYNLKKIKVVSKINKDLNTDDIINFLNKCPNVESLCFEDINSNNLYKILSSINCPKVKEILGTMENTDNKDYDWNITFEKMPLLENLLINELSPYLMGYSIFPIITININNLDFPLLEQLMRNYLKVSPERYLSFNFDDKIEEFNAFWDYFKDKKDILSKVNEINCDFSCNYIDTYFQIEIYDNSIEFLNKNNNKYLFCFVFVPFNDNILEFIIRNKIEYLFILKGGKVNLEELIKCDYLKFVFDDSKKKFLFRNKDNNILEIL